MEIIMKNRLLTNGIYRNIVTLSPLSIYRNIVTESPRVNYMSCIKTFFFNRSERSTLGCHDVSYYEFPDIYIQ